MTLDQFLELFTDDAQQVEIWDCDYDRVVFRGSVSELGYESEIDTTKYEVTSLDTIWEPTTTITVNVINL